MSFFVLLLREREWEREGRWDYGRNGGKEGKGREKIDRERERRKMGIMEEMVERNGRGGKR